MQRNQQTRQLDGVVRRAAERDRTIAALLGACAFGIEASDQNHVGVLPVQEDRQHVDKQRREQCDVVLCVRLGHFGFVLAREGVPLRRGFLTTCLHLT